MEGERHTHNKRIVWSCVLQTQEDSLLSMHVLSAARRERSRRESHCSAPSIMLQSLDTDTRDEARLCLRSSFSQKRTTWSGHRQGSLGTSMNPPGRVSCAFDAYNMLGECTTGSLVLVGDRPRPKPRQHWSHDHPCTRHVLHLPTPRLANTWAEPTVLLLLLFVF